MPDWLVCTGLSFYLWVWRGAGRKEKRGGGMGRGGGARAAEQGQGGSWPWTSKRAHKRIKVQLHMHTFMHTCARTYVARAAAGRRSCTHHWMKLGSGTLGGGGRFLRSSPRARAAVTCLFAAMAWRRASDCVHPQHESTYVRGSVRDECAHTAPGLGRALLGDEAGQ